MQLLYVGPRNIIVGCFKSCARRLKFRLNSQHLIVKLQGPTLLSYVMQDTTHATYKHNETVETRVYYHGFK